MIVPRSWLATPLSYDYGQFAINRSIALSKPPTMTDLGGLFFKQTQTTRRKNAYKGTGTRLAIKFAKGLDK